MCNWFWFLSQKMRGIKESATGVSGIKINAMLTFLTFILTYVFCLCGLSKTNSSG